MSIRAVNATEKTRFRMQQRSHSQYRECHQLPLKPPLHLRHGCISVMVGLDPAIGHPHQIANDAIPVSNHLMKMTGSSPL
jgi:hypothetical protein